MEKYNNRYLYLVLFVSLFIISSSFIFSVSSSGKLYVNNENAEIKVVWSEVIKNPYAILKGGVLSSDGISNFNCNTTGSFMCVKNNTNDKLYVYRASTQLEDGNYTFSIYATDLNGKAMSDFINKEFIIDTHDPLLENFSYKVIDSTRNGKTVEFMVDFNNDDILNQTPVLTIEDVVLTPFPAEFLGNIYKFYYAASNVDTYRTLYIVASDLAGNSINVSKDVEFTAPKPPITNPSNGAVISPNTMEFTFYFFEKLPKTQMIILYDGVLISNSSQFSTPSSVLKNLLYKYQLFGPIAGVNHLFTIEAWDKNGNKLGPYDVKFSINPNAPVMPIVYFENVRGNSDNGIIVDNTPKIEIIFNHPRPLHFTDFNIIDSNYVFTPVDLSFIQTINNLTFSFQVLPGSPLPEGLNSIRFSACDSGVLLNDPRDDNCINNVTSSIIINSGPPNITWVNPKNPRGGTANSEVLVISTNEWAECKEIDRKEPATVNPTLFFIDETGRDNFMYYPFNYYKNQSICLGNGYIHCDFVRIRAQDSSSSAPLKFNYSVVCRDLFETYSLINYADFSLDLNPPVITSIVPNYSINFYLLLNITVNEDSTCKYILVNSTYNIPNDKSDEYLLFYTTKMKPINSDTYPLNQNRKSHTAVIDNSLDNGNILSDGSYKVYVDCTDAAGNFAKNNQFSSSSTDIIKLAKYNLVVVDTSVPLTISGLSLTGVINPKNSSLFFNTNRNSKCLFQFGLLEVLTTMSVNDDFVNKMPVGRTDGFYHQVYLAGNDLIHKDDYFLPQYPDGLFPEGKYSYNISCTTEYATDSLYFYNYYPRFLDGTNDISDNIYLYSATKTFTVDKTPPSGLTVTVIYPDSSYPGYTFLTDRISYSIKKSNASSDAEFFLVAVATRTGLSYPDVKGWQNTTASSGTIMDLNLTNGQTYYIYAKAIDYAKNQQLEPDYSESITVDINSKPSCNDTRLNNEETDNDCGGPNCGKCGENKKCNIKTDCSTNFCSMDAELGFKVCSIFVDLCTNNKKDTTETDIDCGGSCTNKCAQGQKCSSDSDCGKILYCNDVSVCESTCGNTLCESKYGENEFNCAEDCLLTSVKNTTTQDKPKPKPTTETQSGSNFFSILLIIFAILVLIAGGGIFYYTQYVHKNVPQKAQSQTPLFEQRQPMQQRQPLSSQNVQRVTTQNKPYTRKRDLSIMGSFDKSAKVNIDDEKPELKKSGLKLKEKDAKDSEDTLKIKPDLKTSKMSDGPSRKKSKKLGDFDELDKLSDEKDDFDDLNKLDKLSKSKLGDDLDKLAFDDDGDFDKLSQLIGDDNVDSLDKLKPVTSQKKKSDLIDTLFSLKTVNKQENKNIFQQVLLYLLKSGKIDKQELSKILMDLSEKEIIDKKDMMDVLYNIEKELNN
jgi:hypothetical protein